MARKKSQKALQREIVTDQINSYRDQMQKQAEAEMAKNYAPAITNSGMSREDISGIINSYRSQQQEIPKLEEQNTQPTPSISDELKRMEKAKADTTTPRTPGEQQAIDTYYNSLLEASGKQPSTSAPTNTPTTPSSVDYRAELDRVRAMKADTTAPRTEGENQAIDTYLASLEEAQRYLDSQKPVTTKSVKKSGSNDRVTNKSVKNIGTVEIKADGTKNYTKTMSANEQRDYERALLAQSKARGRALSPNEQRDLERAQNAIAQAKEREKVTTETKSVALPTTAKETKGDELTFNTLSKASAKPQATPTPESFHEATQEIIDNQKEKQNKLKFNPMTGNFESDYDRVRRAMEVVGTSDYNSESKFVDRALDPDYRFTGNDKKRAKQIVKDYFNENETAKKINKTNNANAAMAMFNQMSDEEKAEYSRMSALSAKTSPVTSTALGMVGSIPFLGALEDYTAEIAGVPEEYNFSAMKKQAQTQNPLLYMGGDMATKVAEYSTLTPVLEQIPALANVTNGLGTALAGGNSVVGNTIGNVLRGTVADIALDTIPREIENVQNGYNFADVATDAAGNIALNTLYNAGAEAIPYLASGVKNLFKGATPSNELNPLEMAAKNADIENAIKTRDQAIQNIENIESNNTKKNPRLADDTNIVSPGSTSKNDQALSGSFDFNVNQIDETVNPTKFTSNNVNKPDDLIPIPPNSETGGAGNEIIPRGKVSQFATNSMKKGTNLTPEEYKKNVNLKDFIYQNKTEEQSMKDAFKMIEDEGVDNLKARLLSDEAKDLTQSEIDALMSITRTNNATARAMELVGEDASALRAETTEIYKKLRQQSTSNAQALQALAKWSRNTPEGMLMQAENIVSGNIKAKESKLQEMLKKLSRLKKQYDFSPEFEANFLKEAEKLEGLDIDSREAKDIMARLGRMVNDEIPVKLNEKVQAFLMDNMLGNFRTLITRNAGGNVGLAGVEQLAERPLAAGIDRLVSHVTGKRTQAGLTREALAEYISGFGKGLSDELHDLRTGLHTARTGENTLENTIRSNRHVFKNAIQDKADSLVKNGLSVGDRPFYEANYKQTLGDYYRLRKQGVMGDVVQNLSDADFKTYAETAAKLNSLAAVYQNDSQISNALMGFKNSIGEFSEGTLGFDILSQFSMPFVKTPANVVDRAIDYSPLGIVRNTARTIREGGFKGENFDQNRFVNETARNILGTGLMGGAAALASNGAISGSYSDKNNVKQAQKDSGMQEYALNLPNNMQMDISWLPVVGSNAVAAAAAVDAFKNGEGSVGQNLTKGVTAGGEALFDQSMFQGLQRLFGSGESYNSDNTLPENMIEVVKSGFGQAIPSLLRQTAQVKDQYARDLGNSNKDLAFGLLDNYDINSLINNIPILRENTLAPKVDLSGNLVEENQGRGLGSKILEDMILPGKLTEINVNPLDLEAIRLSEATGNEDAYRPKATRSAVDVGETSMTNKEWVDYEQRFGKEVTATGNAVMSSDLYQSADDLTKEKMLKDSYNAVKNAINSEYTGKDVSGSAKAYKEAGGGEKGIEAVVNSVLGKSLASEAGATSNSQTGKMIQEAVQSGDTQKAEEIVETAKTLTDYGLDKPGPTATYTKAQEVIPSLTIEEFATTYKKIDSDNNQGIKQDEIITYLNNGSYSQTEGSQIWNAYGNSTWKKIPKLENGTWKLSKK